MANEARVAEVMATIEANPQHWHQRFYIKTDDCGTTYCMAGWAGKLAGHTDAQLNNLVDGGGIDKVAMDFLGLTEEQADYLFDYMYSDESDGHPTLAEFKKRVTEVTGVTFDEAV